MTQYVPNEYYEWITYAMPARTFIGEIVLAIITILM